MKNCYLFSINGLIYSRFRQLLCFLPYVFGNASAHNFWKFLNHNRRSFCIESCYKNLIGVQVQNDVSSATMKVLSKKTVVHNSARFNLFAQVPREYGFVKYWKRMREIKLGMFYVRCLWKFGRVCTHQSDDLYQFAAPIFQADMNN